MIFSLFFFFFFLASYGMELCQEDGEPVNLSCNTFNYETSPEPSLTLRSATVATLLQELLVRKRQLAPTPPPIKPKLAGVINPCELNLSDGEDEKDDEKYDSSFEPVPGPSSTVTLRGTTVATLLRELMERKDQLEPTPPPIVPKLAGVIHPQELGLSDGAEEEDDEKNGIEIDVPAPPQVGSAGMVVLLEDGSNPPVESTMLVEMSPEPDINLLEYADVPLSTSELISLMEATEDEPPTPPPLSPRPTVVRARKRSRVEFEEVGPPRVRRRISIGSTNSNQNGTSDEDDDQERVTGYAISNPYALPLERRWLYDSLNHIHCSFIKTGFIFYIGQIKNLYIPEYADLMFEPKPRFDDQYLMQSRDIFKIKHPRQRTVVTRIHWADIPRNYRENNGVLEVHKFDAVSYDLRNSEYRYYHSAVFSFLTRP